MPFTSSIPATSIDLLADIRDTFGPRVVGQTAPNNLHGFTGRDIGIPDTPPLKFSEFTGKGLHCGREASMKAFLSKAPSTPYNPNSFAANGHIGNRYQGLGQSTNYPFMRGTINGGCGMFTTLQMINTPADAITNDYMRVAQHCIENTLITYTASWDTPGSASLVFVGDGGAAETPSSVTQAIPDYGYMQAFRSRNNKKVKELSGIVKAYHQTGGCNGGHMGYWFFLPNKWTISSPIGYSTGQTINTTVEPWEAIVVNWVTGSDEVFVNSSHSTLTYLDGTVTKTLGCVFMDSANWYGGVGSTLWVNWTGAPRVFSTTRTSGPSASAFFKISFVGDSYTFLKD